MAPCCDRHNPNPQEGLSPAPLTGKQSSLAPRSNAVKVGFKLAKIQRVGLSEKACLLSRSWKIRR